jgi:hypothetical protein
VAFPVPYNTIGYPGSQWAATFQFLNSDGSLMNITGKTFEYVLRISSSISGAPALYISSSASSANGSITITTGTSSILAVITPTGMNTLEPNTIYAATLWMDPGNTDATVMANGSFNVQTAAAPA